MVPPCAAIPLAVFCSGSPTAAPRLHRPRHAFRWEQRRHGELQQRLVAPGRKLPEEGPGYTIPTLWRERGANYGTDEIVNAIMRAARRVAKEHPGGTLGVADIAMKGGGESKLHRSHENGHDADLIYYAIDDDGRR